MPEAKWFNVKQLFLGWSVSCFSGVFLVVFIPLLLASQAILESLWIFVMGLILAHLMTAIPAILAFIPFRRRNLTGYRHAAMAGALTAAIIALAFIVFTTLSGLEEYFDDTTYSEFGGGFGRTWENGLRTPVGWAAALIQSLIFIAVGGMSGLVGRFAMGRPEA